MKLAAEDAPFNCVLLVLEDLLVDRVGDERSRFAGQSKFSAEPLGELFGGEQCKEIPLYVIDEVVGADLNINLIIE